MTTPNNMDFEPYINSYQGDTRIRRALFIAEQCPSLEIEGYRFAVDQVKQLTHDLELYQTTLNKLNAALTRRGQPQVDSDQTWVDSTKKENKHNLEQLEQELKTYKSSVIKESIRVAQSKLGDYYYDIGNVSEAIKCYSKTRDLCVTSKNIVEMCFSLIKAHLKELRYAQVTTYILRASATPQIPDKINTMSRLNCYQAISTLFTTESNRYQAVAECLTQHVALESHHLLSDIMSPSDVATFGGLCALASFTRPQLHDLINNNLAFRGYLEWVPHIRDIMEQFYASKYTQCFALMEQHKDDWKMDLYLNSHVDKLFQCIRERAMIQYCIPYSIIDMRRMASVFNMTVENLELDLVNLIGQNDRISARIDSYEKVLYTKRQDQRKKAFDQSFALGAEYEKSSKALMLRMNLLKADMVVR
ncbi:26S proteasome subunit RPN7-domain-containing protein [Chlamydoabsidia padenii]|nr:26S proteasome subunit RPN7-domain-containing protein [Chlamydoabsidia padenii]